MVGLSQDYTFLNCIRHFHVRNKKGTEGKMRPAVVSRIVTVDAPVSYWPFFPVSSNSPEVFANVKLAQFPSHFLNGKLQERLEKNDTHSL